MELLDAFGTSCAASNTLKGLGTEQERWQSLEDLMFERRTQTLVVRAGSFELYCHWAKTQEFDPFPIEEPK
eukprot:1076358-Karenia_brevis.AAC.1